MRFHYFRTFGSSKNSYFVFISIFCIHFLNLRTKKTVYPIWHLILHMKKKKKILFSLIYSQSFSTIFNIFTKIFTAEPILLKIKMRQSCFHIPFSFTHFFWVLKAKTKTKNKPKQSFSCVNPKKIENKNRIRTVFQVTKNGHPTF